MYVYIMYYVYYYHCHQSKNTKTKPNKVDNFKMVSNNNYKLLSNISSLCYIILTWNIISAFCAKCSVS